MLAGWAFAAERLSPSGKCCSGDDAGAEPTPLATLERYFRESDVDAFASTHTCLAHARDYTVDGRARFIMNNGAAGLPNFAGTRFGLITRISIDPRVLEQSLYGITQNGVRFDALPVRYDHAAWLERFLADWPPGSPAHEACFKRIVAGPAFEREHSGWSLNTLKHWALAIVLIIFFAGSWQLAQVDLARLATGLPKLWHWLWQAWPPKLDELPVFLLRTGETIAMAAIGTAAATLLAIPMAILASRNITPFPKLYYPARWFLNALRGIDSFVFALFFVASVGLGPFAGVLGIALHTWGSAAKFIADYVENANLGPL